MENNNVICFGNQPLSKIFAKLCGIGLLLSIPAFFFYEMELERMTDHSWMDSNLTEFSNFKAFYGKQYSDSSEELLRHRIFN